MPNSAQILFALAMAVWVVDVRFAPKQAHAHATTELADCQNGPSVEAPPVGADLELVVCAPRSR